MCKSVHNIIISGTRAGDEAYLNILYFCEETYKFGTIVLNLLKLRMSHVSSYEMTFTYKKWSAST